MHAFAPLALALVALHCASVAHAEAHAARWRRLDAPAGIHRAEALALDAAGARLAIGGERGVAWGPPGGPFERVLARGPVRDLAFAPDGALLAATDAGLYRIEGVGRVRSEPIAPGEAARAVRDLDVAEGRSLAATDAGVFERAAGAWRRVAGMPFGEARRAAIAAGAVWALVDGALWRADARGAARVSLPGALGGEGGPLDLARGQAGALLVLWPRSLAVRDADGGWRHERLVLPPGATPVRVASEPGTLWLATDAGLLFAPGPAGPWRRAGPPAGHVAVAALAGEGAGRVVATAHGLLRVAAADSRVASAAPPHARRDPPVLAVQRRALRYLALEPERMRALARGATRRGWWPELSLRVDAGAGRDRGRDRDQSVSSGVLYHTVDRERGSDEDYGASLVLSWDFGDLAYHPESVDVSREARLVAQLRDDVLDEINQLYFERQRVLSAAAAPPPDASPAALRLRAAELASGLDAWTGGWFSAQLSASGPDSPAQEPSE